MSQLVQIIGSMFILLAFALAQRGSLNNTSPRYVSLNLIGATALAVDAAVEEQWGFLLLEGIWALISAVSLVATIRGRAGAHPTGNEQTSRLSA